MGLAAANSETFRHTSLMVSCPERDNSLSSPAQLGEAFPLIVRRDGPPHMGEEMSAGTYKLRKVLHDGTLTELKATYNFRTQQFGLEAVHAGDVLLIVYGVAKELQLQFIADPAHAMVSFQPCTDPSSASTDLLDRSAFFCKDFQVCTRQQKVKLEEFRERMSQAFVFMTVKDRVRNVTQFLDGWLAERQLLFGFKLGADATLSEQIRYNDVLSESIIANFPLHNSCSTDANPSDVRIPPVRIVAENILTLDECKWLERLFYDRSQKNKEKNKFQTRPGETFIDFLNVGTDYAWDNDANYTQLEVSER
jgi:hypothetical protein